MEITGKTKEECKKIKQDKHSAWLTFMYPRLYLAKKLLKDTGVIFVSIDDNEQANLKLLMDEVFGEINFIAELIRKTSYGEKTSKPKINKHHDYILLYSKVIEEVVEKDILKGEEKNFDNYQNPDNDSKGDWIKDSVLIKIDSGRYGYARYPIFNKYLNKTHYPPVYYDESDRKQWHYIEDTFKKLESEGAVVYYKSEEEYSGEYSFYIKKYKKDIQNKYNNFSTLFSIDNEFVNAKGTKDMSDLFEENIFYASYPKPVILLKKLIDYSCNKDSLILDFFAGSATTADAVMQLNAEDGGNRKYIMVQIPEILDEKSVAYKSGYKTIDEISRERIKRAANKIKEENPEHAKNADLGFKHYYVKKGEKENEIYK